MSGLAEARRPLAEVVAALGWSGDDRRGYPCPACGEAKRDRRGAVGVSRGGMGWECHLCKARGDGIDYAAIVLVGGRLAEVPRERRRVVADWLRAQGWLTGPSSPYQMVDRPPPPEERPPAPPAYPPRDEVEALWAACHPVTAGGDDVQSFLEARRLSAWRALVRAEDLARVTPMVATWPEWWPAGRSRCWRLVVRGWTARGELGSLHARAVVPPPVLDDRPAPKTLWAKGYEARELLFACPEGLALLRGNPSRELFAVLVAEGLTDWLTLAAWAAWHRKPGLRVAVLGGASGSFRALADVRWPDWPLDVVAAVDEDDAGDRYLLEVAEALGDRPLRRTSATALAPRAAA